ncbi:MAG: helix-hairpin-helix domain-containing protein [Bacteroidales bacterium]
MKGESNSKARGIIILIAALLIFQIGTFIWKTVEERTAREPETKSGMMAGGDDKGRNHIGNTGTPPGNGRDKSSRYRKNNRDKAQLFLFNPNTIPLDSLVLLGFSPKQAQTILNYRNKGGRFRKKEDFAKMYVVGEQKYATLEQWIDIPVEIEKYRGSGGAAKLSGSNIKAVVDTGKSEKKAPYVPYIPQAGKTQWICNLNTADSTQLVKLYGIGPYFARKILQYRQRLGGSFADAKQLLEIEGMDLEKYAKFEHKIVVNEVDIKKFTIEELNRKFMEQHPYIGAYAARGIILYREGKPGKITVEELVKENILLPEPASRLKLYLK